MNGSKTASETKPSFSTLKNDLDEVEELTTRVRDSISVDLLNTRRYSPLLYEYYRKHLELAKSIQCTYNIQCNSLFDAMTLMRKCLRDYCQTVHNPEYLAFDTIHADSGNHFSFSDYVQKNNLNRESNNSSAYQSNTLPHLSAQANNNASVGQGFSQRLFQIPSAPTNLKSNGSIHVVSNQQPPQKYVSKMVLPTNPYLSQNDKISQRNSDFVAKMSGNICEESSSSSSAISTTSSTMPALRVNHTSSTIISSSGITSNNMNSNAGFEVANKVSLPATIDNKQTYV